MKINKQAQYGMLLALYLTKAGRSNLGYIAEGLNLSKSFTQQVARKLRLAGVIKSVRGKYGGYELVGEPTVKDIFNALSPIKLLTAKESANMLMGGHETRAFLMMARSLGMSFTPVMNRKVSSLIPELMANDTARFNRIANDASVN